MNLFKEALSEDDGKGSLSRIGTGLTIVMTLAWVTFLVLKNGQLPDLGGITLFVTGIVGVLMGINKATSIAGAITGK